jgi:N-acetylglucosamine kinase-like BadF-type ATPase
VSDEHGRLLGFGQSGLSKRQGCGLAAAMMAVEHAGAEALTAAGVTADIVAIVSCGLGGADLPEDFAMLQPALEDLRLGTPVDLRNDTQVALRAGTHQSWGVVAICGTGFNVAGRGPDGREKTFPDLGWLSGDWGGAGMVATEMVRLVMRADDGRGPATALTPLLLGALEQPSAYQLMRARYHEQIKRP